MVYLTTFISGTVNIHTTSVERADDLYLRQLGKILSPPYWDGLRPTQTKSDRKREEIRKDKNKKKSEKKDGETDADMMSEVDDVRDEEISSKPGTSSRIAAYPALATYDISATGPPSPEGWKKNFADLVISGVGWVSLRGCGGVKLRIHVPHGTAVHLREPLLPAATGKIHKHGKVVRSVSSILPLERPLPGKDNLGAEIK
jgi:hypothetical protein